METTDKGIVRMLAELCVAHGVTEVVMSPGSRNAPLSVAFNRMADLHCRVVVDERSAGFFALGVAQATSRPVVVVCTSGTALLNLSPAVAEAYYQSVPLIVVSADRPKEWIDQNDSQTIRQEDALRNFVKRSYQLPMDEQGDNRWYANRMINDAMATAMGGRKAPVHINVPLSEPLYGVSEADFPSERVVRSAVVAAPLRLDEAVAEDFAVRFRSSKRVMVLAGFMHDVAPLRDLLAQFAERRVAAVVTEPISNLCSEFSINQPELFFSSINADEIDDFAPDLLITLGGALVSKSAKLFFRNHPPRAHWHIGVEEWTIDTFRCLTDRVEVDPRVFFEQLMERLLPSSDYPSRLLAKMELALQSQSQAMASSSWGENKAFSLLMNALPDGVSLHLSNGLSVRLGQRFPWHQQIRFFANRGTSGIDGSTSTAVGFSAASGGMTVLLSGDISFLYDSNALWNDFLSSRLKIVVVNNGGGGIFRRLTGPSSLPEMCNYFETPHCVDIAQLAAAYGVGHLCANNESSLMEILPTFFSENEKPMILEVVCE